MLNKRRKTLSSTNFFELYQTMKTKSHIDKELYEKLDLAMDQNYSGEDIEKPDGRSQEIAIELKY